MMIELTPIIAVVVGIALLLFLILKFKIQAFIALLIASITTGLIAGLSAPEIIQTIQDGMGGTLGFVATVVGLGAMFGALLETSGGAETLANTLIRRFGEEKAPWALTLTGFLVAIPVFFDVAFIILVPVLFAIQRKTKKSLLLYAIPLLAGLAVTHAFIPPTPGPVAVAQIINADLGWVILFGFITGIPTTIISGALFGKYIARKIHIEAPSVVESSNNTGTLPGFGSILGIISIPILLIVGNTLLNSPIFADGVIPISIKEMAQLIGHPFIALIIANLFAWLFLGLKHGKSKEDLLSIMTKSMAPAGIIILLTGAGGVFKQTLINIGSGEMLATYFADKGMSLFILAYLSSFLVRILQGSATVAMITAAGLIAPLLSSGNISEPATALLVIAIASGASALSHVNDSGFWLVGKYLGLNEKQTFRSWSMSTTILSIVGFLVTLLLSVFV